MKLIPAKAVVMESSNVTPDDMRDYMFDEYLSTQTVASDTDYWNTSMTDYWDTVMTDYWDTVMGATIVVEIEFNNVDRLALFNIDATSVELELTNNDTATVVQTKTIDLEISAGVYTQWVIEPMYIYADATLKVTILNTQGSAKCGLIGTGLSTDIGATKIVPSIGFIDYSIKSTNEFGNTYLKQGNWAKLPNIKTLVKFEAIDAVYEDLIAVRGALSFFEGNEGDTDYEAFRVYGFIEDWTMLIDNKSIAWLTLNIKGAI